MLDALNPSRLRDKISKIVHYLSHIKDLRDLRLVLSIVEYNGKFPPPFEFQFTYDATHAWQGTDYFGASLASYVKHFHKHGYRLLCCNAMRGANAFFVDARFSDRVSDVPEDVETLFVAPRYFRPKKHGHPASLRTIETILNKL